jgi:hypothetical protein
MLMRVSVCHLCGLRGVGPLVLHLLVMLWIIVSCAGCGTSFPHDTTALIGAAPPHTASKGNVTFADPVTLTLNPGTSGTWESPVITSTLGVEDLIVSWNVTCPADTYITFEASVLRESGEGDGGWSPWLYLGGAGALPIQPRTTQATGGLKADVDLLTSTTWFRQARVRATAYNASTQSTDVILHRVDVTRSLAFARAASGIRKNATLTQIPWDKWELPTEFAHEVPFASQRTPRPELSGRLCSPASVTMALRWAGKATEVIDVANAAYDQENNLYGNWPRNVQAAFERGLPARIERFGSLRDVYRTLHSGSLIIASIVAKPGELRNAPYKDTDGHLIVIRGYNSRGDLLVLDPAVSTPELGSLTYAREDMVRVWLLNRRGTAYVLWPSTPTPTPVPATSLP